MSNIERAVELDNLARELDAMTVIERAYAMKAYLLFLRAANLRDTTAHELIIRLNEEQVASLPLGHDPRR